MFLYLITGDVNHDHLAKVIAIMFLHFKVTIFNYLRNDILILYVQTCCFSSKFSPTNFSIHMWILQKLLLFVCCALV